MNHNALADAPLDDFPDLRSSANPTVKRVIALHKGARRRKAGVALVEGIKFVSDLADRPDRLDAVFWSEALLDRPGGEALLDKLDQAGVHATSVTPQLLSAMADTTTPQGVLAVVDCVPAPGDELLARPGPVLVLAGVQDPGNVGTLIRTAEAAGCAGVILDTDCADPTAPRATRASAGAVFRLPFARWNGGVEALAGLISEAGCTLCVADGKGTQIADLTDQLTGRLAWVVGGEGTGISDEWRAAADQVVALPMAGEASSLNVATAGALVLYWASG